MKPTSASSMALNASSLTPLSSSIPMSMSAPESRNRVAAWLRAATISANAVTEKS